MSFEWIDLAKIPINIDTYKMDFVTSIVESNVAISKTDWDAFETSYDFERHPLV